MEVKKGVVMIKKGKYFQRIFGLRREFKRFKILFWAMTTNYLFVST
jgi:hypothetical protein